MSVTAWSAARRTSHVVHRVAQFWQRVDTTGGPEACWLWHGAMFRNGYGKASWRNRTQNAHRIALILASGGNRARLHADHLCRVKQCCNPTHLEWVTARENTRRRSAVRLHCRFGHPLDHVVHSRTGNYRRCSACLRNAVRRWQARHRRAACEDS